MVEPESASTAPDVDESVDLGEEARTPAPEMESGGVAKDAAPTRFSGTAERLIRVGLATDLMEVELPEGEAFDLRSAGRVVARSEPVVVRPVTASTATGAFHVQAAALKDEQRARELARRLTERLGMTSDVVFDADIDLYRVRVGSFTSRETAEATARRMLGLGLASARVQEETMSSVDAGFIVERGPEIVQVPGRWIRVHSASGLVPFGGRSYRGDLLIYLNDRGALNLINELPMEEYLRGVVPLEMGPEVYDELEALKAQAVAARTYALRNVGSFLSEGYDICSTPRCQVYGGQSVEESLTDRAVRETAGEVLLWHDQLVDARYSSTCGGHTEDGDAIFPLIEAPYLQGVPCVEGARVVIPGRIEGPEQFPRALMADVLPSLSDPVSAANLEVALERLATLAGLSIPEDSLASLRRGEVVRFLGSVFDLAVDARLFTSQQDVLYLLQDPPQRWTDADEYLAAYLVQSGLLEHAHEEFVGQETLYRLALHLALYLRILERREVTFLNTEDSVLRVRAGEEVLEFDLGGRPWTYRSYGEETRRARLGRATALPGDQLELLVRGGQLLALIHRVNPAGAAADRSSRHSWWTRFRSREKLAASVAQRYPGFHFLEFEVLERGVSGRATEIVLRGAEGRTETLQGLAIRWLLDVPDTLFTARYLEPVDGTEGWLFTGRGWGHGVGMCQVGAFGMAQRGLNYRQILSHYYSGVRIGHVKYAPPEDAPAAAPAVGSAR